MSEENVEAFTELRAEPVEFRDLGERVVAMATCMDGAKGAVLRPSRPTRGWRISKTAG
jgi:hypothetical protein